LPRLIAGVDAVVVPSVWWENDPVIVRQAAAAGRPVLYADLGGLAEAGQQSGGMGFAAGDVAALAQRLLAVLQNAPGVGPHRAEPALAAIGGKRQKPERMPA
jgi:glycosyltransferase involved in cell wall biosynthesis